MSRSNPSEHIAHPCTRWHEWDGAKGEIRNYNKIEKKNIVTPLPFQFILLDALSTIKGWHEPSESGIYSNEVRDTKQDVFVVKSFKGGLLAQGHYQTIRDRVAAVGGSYVQNLYVAFKNETGELVLGSLQLKGAALNAWIEFGKQNLADLYKKSVKIIGFKEGKKGSIVFRFPEFILNDITPETEKTAVALDVELQKFLRAYFARSRSEQTEKHADDESNVEPVDSPTRLSKYENQEVDYRIPDSENF